jgi:dTDP-4-amino-4,6-dideoxygalactose transaminase
MWSYKDHGKSYEAVYEREHPPGFRWLHESFGTNWRMMEVQGAIGRIQLRQMERWTEVRQRNSAAIAHACFSFSLIRTPIVPEYIEHACYKHYCFIEPNMLSKGWDRDRIVAEIIARGVPCFQGSCSEVYLEKAFDGTGWRPHQSLPVAKELGETSLMFLVHPTLTSEEIEKTCNVIRDVLSLAQRLSL